VTRKPDLAPDEVQDIIRGHFGTPGDDVAPIATGESSQVLRFDAGGAGYVLRCNATSLPFAKDTIARGLVTPLTVPVPPIVAAGHVRGTLRWAIAERAEGMLVVSLARAPGAAALPRLFTILDAIHAADVRHTSGYGIWDGSGRGAHRSWSDAITEVCGVNPGIYRAWEREDGGGDTTLTLVRERMRTLLNGPAPPRGLVHGDYGSNNVLIAGSRVTAVLDWEVSRYGDPLYDIAWMAFWDREHDVIAAYRRHVRRHSSIDPGLDDRLRCCLLNIGLGAQPFFAERERWDEHDACARRTLGYARSSGTVFPV
jgi:hygromycin-B 4-O-kinase